ncbi:melibiose:sodium transporter MelB [Halioglobus sp. HI00S01]|uniref:melibiose:sodium transporter MelB n=1 Tax=Halioglobus sp. HI00S01 TaxID=1822214 RepID=UPI000ACB55CA|nr:melibiose:sodium transporter MelB [Halioglobus sp. HI00S01]
MSNSNEMDAQQSDTVSLGTKVSYGLGALGKDFACSIIYIFLMYYYTDVAGLSAAFVGTLFLVARVVDAVTDPMMGLVVDNTRSRFGKFRPWIVIGTLVNSFALVAVFSTHMLTGPWLYVYAAVTYILWGVTYTIMDIPYWSMVPALSSSRPQRERLVVWPRIFASIAWMLMGGYGLWAVGILGGDNKGEGFFYLSLAIVVSFVASALITFFMVKEKFSAPATAARFTMADVKNIIMSNDQLKVLIGVVLTFNIAIQLIGGFAIYYYTYAVGREDLYPTFALASGAAEIAGVFVFPWLCRVLPRRTMWLLACAFPVLCSMVLLFTGIFSPESALLAAIAGGVLKFGGGLSNGLSTVMLADVVDYGEYRTGQRSESIIFSVQTMLVKFAGAFSGFFIGVGLSLVGYIPNVVQSEETVLGLRFMMIGTPFILVILSALIYRSWYKLHDQFQEQVIEHITTRKGVPAEA